MQAADPVVSSVNVVADLLAALNGAGNYLLIERGGELYLELAAG
jgi:hypothetical protein